MIVVFILIIRLLEFTPLEFETMLTLIILLLLLY